MNLFTNPSCAILWPKDMMMLQVLTGANYQTGEIYRETVNQADGFRFSKGIDNHLAPQAQPIKPRITPSDGQI